MTFGENSESKANMAWSVPDITQCGCSGGLAAPPKRVPTQEAQVVERGFGDVDGEHLLGSAFEGLHDEFGSDGASAAGDQDAGSLGPAGRWRRRRAR